MSRLLRFQNGVNAPAEKYGRGVKFVSVSDIIQNDYVTYDNIAGSVDIDDATLERYSVENGDMVFQRSSETVEDIGRANVYLDNRTATFGGFVIRGKKIGEYNPYFFKCLLYSNEARRKVIRAGAGAQHYNIGQEALSQIHLYFPEMAEQCQIADLLLLVSNRIDAQRKLVELLKKHKRGVIDALFTPDATWTTARFEDVFTILRNNALSRDSLDVGAGDIYNIHYGDVLIKFGELVDVMVDGVPVIKSSVILARPDFLRNGDVVFADTAEDYDVGKVVEILDCCASKVVSGLHTIPCRPKCHFAPGFLGFYLNSHQFRKNLMSLVQGTKVSSISKSALKGLTVCFPDECKQRRIAAILRALTQRINGCESVLAKLERMKKGLLLQLFV